MGFFDKIDNVSGSNVIKKVLDVLSCGYIYTGWYLRQKPVGGGSKAGGLPTLPFPVPPPPFHSPKFSDKPVGGKVRSSEREVPRLPPPTYNTLDAFVQMQWRN